MTDVTSDEWQRTACILCSINCGLKVKTENGRITKIIGDKDHPISEGYVCEKAQRLDYYQNGADRITSPMRRKDDGSYEAVDWDTAITEIAAKLKTVRDNHGGDKILYYGGGGQGNHLGGAYTDSLLKALGVKYRSNALAQEKTGEFWVNGKMLGTGAHGDFEHCEVAMFVGKNPWQSHGFARARAVIRDIQKDPNRKMVVIDPRLSETAAKASHHLQLKPGTDAWCLGALLGIIVQEGLIAQQWLADHAIGLDEVLPALQAIDVEEYARVCDVPLELLRDTARTIAQAKSVSIFEDLGMQMSVHSTLGSYLQRLIALLTGNYGKEGTMNAYVPFLSLAKASKGETSAGKTKRDPKAKGKVSPVTGSKIIIGLIPCNVIPDEILTDHPDRFRAMIVDSGNPCHSLADSQRMRESMRAVEFSLVIDVAMTETAQQADYVLPASSQFEKAESTFFNVEFPNNGYHLRQPLFEPKEGTLPEAEMVCRIIEAMGDLSEKDYKTLRRAAKFGRYAFTAAFVVQVARKPKLMKYVSAVLYRTLGETLPLPMKNAAAVWGMCVLYVQASPKAAKRAGFGGPLPVAANKLFNAIINSPSGVIHAKSNFAESWKAIGIEGGKIQLHIPEMVAELGRIGLNIPDEQADFPFVLSAGERRSETANTAIRNPAWHKKGQFAALRINPDDAAQIGCETGDVVRLVTNRATAEVAVEVSEMMRRGHVSLPNGVGVRYVDENGEVIQQGVAPNELTDNKRRDFLAGTPWHKHVPAKIELIDDAEKVA